MNASNNKRYIPWFNPREMPSSTVAALAIGLDELLQDFITFARRRLENFVKPTASAHWLVTGQRGTGKSFFLRYAQIKVPEAFPVGIIRFVLLPEELRNVRAPHDLLDEIRRMLEAAQGESVVQSLWRTKNPEKCWEESLETLLTAFSEPLLIVGIENFAQLFNKVFKDDIAGSMLRKLMEHEARILFLATAVDGSFDDDYGNRFFRQFEKHPLQNWDSHAHRKYLEERARLASFTPSLEQLARIDAYSRYTGGNARIAAILAGAILDERDIVEASEDLNATIDRISDYYRAQLDALPTNSEFLFDALIRGGEPCSQTQLAERVGARQSDISQAFSKLLEVGYLLAHRPKGQKETRYQVADRLFVQWYRMRCLDPGQRSSLAVMADLLAEIITFREKLRFAERFSTQGEHDNALLMTELAYRERDIDIKPLRAIGINLLNLAQRMKIGQEDLLDLMEMFPSDTEMRNAKEEALILANSCTPHFNGEPYSGEKLANFILASVSLCAAEKLRFLRAIPTIAHSSWDAVIKVSGIEKQMLAGLTTEESIQKIVEKHNNEWQHPWLDGWSEIRRFRKLEAHYRQWPKNDFEIVKTVICAVEWLHRFRKGDKLAPLIFSELLKSKNKAAFDHGWRDESFQIYKRLFDALPERKECAWERAILLSSQSCIFNYYNRPEQALQSAREALLIISDPAISTGRDKAGREIVSMMVGSALGALNRWPEALACHQEILPLLAGNDVKAWHAGQAARYLWRIKGLASAWDLIAAQNLRADYFADCIGQLSDGVYDIQRVDGIPQTYAAGRNLLTDLIQQANDPARAGKLLLEKTVRLVFIKMLDTGLDLQVLQDLAQDLPSFDLTIGELKPLAEMLYRWFDELRNAGVTGNNTMPPDPDWSTTVAALNEELSFSARLRLGLAETPRLSAEAVSVFGRILAFIK